MKKKLLNGFYEKFEAVKDISWKDSFLLILYDF